ncbi:MAG: TetR/AcrR family transcriptional regulator [Novosphingobium sp.]
MVHNVEALARRQERTEARRDQVLDAAEKCFLAEGFHKASMARIAAKAKMSVGHIYQYFENKEAIIIALCERRFAGFERRLLQAEQAQQSELSPLIDAWTTHFAWWIEPVRTPLTLEIMSEAGRNHKVAKVVEKIDRRFRDIMRRSLLPLAGTIPEHEVEARLEAIVMLSHGMTSRMTADHKVKPEDLIVAFRLSLRMLLSESDA